MLEFSIKKVAWDSLYLWIKFKVGLHHQGVHAKKNQEKKRSGEWNLARNIGGLICKRGKSERWAHLQENNQNQSREYITTKMLVCGTLSNAQIGRVCV